MCPARQINGLDMPIWSAIPHRLRITLFLISNLVSEKMAFADSKLGHANKDVGKLALLLNYLTEPQLNARFRTPAMAALAELLPPEWWGVMADWLPRFDGFRAELECDENLAVDDTPALEIISALECQGKCLSDPEIASLIASCAFNGWRARFANSPFRWSPLYQGFSEFRMTYDAPPICYEISPDMIPVTAGWLLGMLYLKKQ